MINLSHEASRHIPPPRVASMHAVPNRCRELLAKARPVVTHELLTAWRPEARALVDILERALATALSKVAAFEATVPALEEAAENERQARAELARAAQEYAQGSLDGQTHLARRDAVDAAAGALTVRAAERAAAVSATLAVEPPTFAGIDEEGLRRIVKVMADNCMGQKFDPGTTAPISREKLERWYAMSDVEFVYIPLIASGIIKDAQDKAKPPAADSWRSVPVELPIAEFVEFLATFKRDKEAFQRAKLAKAQAEIEAAMR